MAHFAGLIVAPTELAVQKGVYGNEFDPKCAADPAFNLCDILNINLTAEALEARLKHEFSVLGDDFIDRLSTMLLQDNLGNGGHWGLGFFVEPFIFLNDEWQFSSRITFEYLFKANETRFFSKTVDLDDFNSRDFASTDEMIATDNLNFLNRRALEMFFPKAFCVQVRPGQIFMFTPKVLYKRHRVSFEAGTDVWYQGNESIDLPRTELKGFNTAIAFKPTALQFKIFGGVGLDIEGSHSLWNISLNADKTVASSGIGKDFTVAATAAVSW